MSGQLAGVALDVADHMAQALSAPHSHGNNNAHAVAAERIHAEEVQMQLRLEKAQSMTDVLDAPVATGNKKMSPRARFLANVYFFCIIAALLINIVSSLILIYESTVLQSHTCCVTEAQYNEAGGGSGASLHPYPVVNYEDSLGWYPHIANGSLPTQPDLRTCIINSGATAASDPRLTKQYLHDVCATGTADTNVKKLIAFSILKTIFLVLAAVTDIWLMVKTIRLQPRGWRLLVPNTLFALLSLAFALVIYRLSQSDVTDSTNQGCNQQCQALQSLALSAGCQSRRMDVVTGTGKLDVAKALSVAASVFSVAFVVIKISLRLWLQRQKTRIVKAHREEEAEKKKAAVEMGDKSPAPMPTVATGAVPQPGIVQPVSPSTLSETHVVASPSAVAVQHQSIEH